MKKLIIAIDFDGTIFEVEEWPEIGNEVRNAKSVINKWYDLGHTIIINTLREGKYADMAKKALKEADVKYHYFNENEPEGIKNYYDSRKIGADIYIDDRNIEAKAFGIRWGFYDYLIGRMTDD